MSYRVTGTLRPGGKQQKRVFQSLEDAQAQQDLWNAARIQGAAALRPKITHLTQQQLKEAEAAIELLKGGEFTLIDAVKHLMQHKPKKAADMTYQEGFECFLSENIKRVGALQDSFDVLLAGLQGVV